MGVTLTRQDVFDLLHNSDSHSRLLVTQKICTGYNEKLYAEDELQIAQEIFRLLAKDTEVLIRSTLSNSLKLADDLPHDVALTLAKDVEEVAIPMLEFSSLLTDSDLLEIIYTAEVQKLLAVSRRARLTHPVAKGLLDKKNEEVTTSVLSNKSFINNKPEYKKLIAEAASNEAMLKKIIEHSTLPATVSEKLLTEHSGQIIRQIRAKYDISPAKFDRYVSHSLEISTLSVIDHQSRADEIDYLVNHLSLFGRLTPSLILSSICMGRKRFFISALAKRAGIPKCNAVKLIEHGGREGLYALLASAGIPEKLFEAVEVVVKLIDKKKANDPEVSVKEFCSWLVSQLEYLGDKGKIGYLTYMIAIAKQSQKLKVTAIY